MNSFWKMIARRYLAELIEDLFREESPDLMERLQKLGLPAETATMILELVKGWLIERAGKV